MFLEVRLFGLGLGESAHPTYFLTVYLRTSGRSMIFGVAWACAAEARAGAGAATGERNKTKGGTESSLDIYSR